MDAPEVTLYTADRERLVVIGQDWDELAVTVEHAAVGAATFTTGWDLVEDVPMLAQQGLHLTVDHWARRIFSGPVVAGRGAGPTRGGSLTLVAEDDWRWMRYLLCYPSPTRPLTQQQGYRRISGPSETVLLTALRENATRAGLPLVVPASQGRGRQVRVDLRFHTLEDRVGPLLDATDLVAFAASDGLGVDLVQQPYPSQLVEVRIRPTRIVEFPLTERSGTLDSWEWSWAAPEVTRGVIGGAGEGAARTLRGSVRSSVEAAWGLQAEVFVDARDVQLDTESTEPDALNTQAKVNAALDARLAERLDEGASKAGFRAVLAESDAALIYPGVDPVTSEPGIWKGDQVTVETLGGVTHTDLIRSVDLSWGPEGYRPVPKIGDVEEGPLTAVEKHLRKLSARIRAQGLR